MKIDISNKLSKNIFFFVLFCIICMLTISENMHAQTVTQPVTGVSATMKKYIYLYILSKSEKKDIEYILVKSSKGEIVSVFNACDVCYAAHKGYSQNGNLLRCNNCGRSFLIDTLGRPGTEGKCLPGYLPHKINGANVEINISNLVKGEYFFLTTPYTDVFENSLINDNFTLINNRNDLILKTPSANPREFKIFSLDGNLINSFSSVSSEVNIPIGSFPIGTYLLSIMENGKYISKFFIVY